MNCNIVLLLYSYFWAQPSDIPLREISQFDDCESK